MDSPQRSAIGARLLRNLVPALCILAALAPFVVPHIPVMGTDVPKHVMVARVLSSYNQAKYGYASHFDLSFAPRSTILGALALAGLAKFMDPFDAAKAYLALFIAGLWFAGRFLAVRCGQPAIAGLLLLPLAHSGLVFLGLMPFIVTIPLYALLLGVLIGQPRGLARPAWICLLLLFLYGFHVFGLAAGCLAVVLFAFDRKDRWRVAWSDLLAMAPAVCLAGYFLFHERGNSSRWIYQSPLGQLKVYLGYNAWSLSGVAGLLFIGMVLALAAWVAWQAYRERKRPRLLLLAAAMVVAGLLLPVQMANWYVVGSRTFPFVVIASLAFLRFSERSAGILAAVVLGYLTVSAGLNTRIALKVQDQYRIFFSGIPAVDYGSRILPIVEAPDGVWNRFIEPFGGIEDAYNIYRGGSNPYCLAWPFYQTGATILRSRYGLEYAFKYSDETPVYSGVSRKYDYVVVYGKLPGVRQALAEEMCVAFVNGPLSVYRKCQGGTAR
jgi:hypothetical protein